MFFPGHRVTGSPGRCEPLRTSVATKGWYPLTAIDPHAPSPSSAGQSYDAQHGTGPVSKPSLVQPVGCRRVMSTGIGITLVAAGVILRFAVPATFTYSLQVHVAAVIVMLAGVFCLLMSLLVWGPLSRRLLCGQTAPAAPAGDRSARQHRRRHLHHPLPAHHTIDPAVLAKVTPNRAKVTPNRWLRESASLPRTAWLSRTAWPSASGPEVVC